MPIAAQYPDGVLREMNRLGLGDATQTVSTVSAGASTALSIPAVAGALGLSSATAALVAGPIIGGVAFAVMAWLNRKGPKQKVATTQIVEEAEPILVQNLNAFLSGPRTKEDQAFALATFDKIWSEVQKLCNDPGMGNPGKNCISAREAGACHYKTSPGGWQQDGTYLPPGANNNGSECWNWFVGYRDPIANAPLREPAIAGGAFEEAGGILQSSLGANWPVLIGGTLILLGIAMSNQKGKR